MIGPLKVLHLKISNTGAHTMNELVKGAIVAFKTLGLHGTWTSGVVCGFPKPGFVNVKHKSIDAGNYGNKEITMVHVSDLFKEHTQ
jgi:hypothetical protein